MTEDDKKEAYKALMWLFILTTMVLFFQVRHVHGGEVIVMSLDCPATACRADKGRWMQDRVPVHHNPTGSPMAVELSDQAIKYAIWSWRERTGLNLVWAGHTSRPQIDGAIVVQWATAWDMTNHGGDFFTLGVNRLTWRPATGEIVRSVSTINTGFIGLDFRSGMRTLIHELGHALGIIGHADDPEAIMFASSASNRYALTPLDVRMTQYESHICHAEITPHGDVYIPGIIGAGVTLTPDSDYRITHDHLTGETCSGELTEGGALIYDVRGYDASFVDVTLGVDGNNVTVTGGRQSER